LLKAFICIITSFPGKTAHSHDTQVAVVGGGMAGLAAASSLSEAGFDVVLLEAADYLGKERFVIVLFVDCSGQHWYASSSLLSSSSSSLSLWPSLWPSSPSSLSLHHQHKHHHFY